MTKIYTYDKPDAKAWKNNEMHITSIEFYERERRGKIYYGAVFTWMIHWNNRFTTTSKRFKTKEEGNKFFLQLKKNLSGLKLIEVIDD